MNEYDNNEKYIKKEDEEMMDDMKKENELQPTPEMNESETVNTVEPTPVEPVAVEPAFVEASYAETLFNQDTPDDDAPVSEAPVDEAQAEDTTSETMHTAENQTEPTASSPSQEYHYQEEVKKTPKRKKTWSKFIAACLVVSVAGGSSIGAGYAMVSSMLKPQMVVTTTTASAQKTSSTSNGYSTVDIVKSVRPSVVPISTTISGTTQYFGSFSIPYESSGAGSGVIFYSDETRIAIATNNHVVDGATSIYVAIGSDNTMVPATVVGTKSDSDLAVLSVSWNDLREAGVSEITVAVFGDSDALEVGEDVIAIGNAMGMGISATNGIISMTEQTINVDETELTVLQTNAAINSGNSGGALVNSNGEVIGINTAKYNSSMAEGMGYAIPSNVIIPIIEELLQNGTQPSPYIGIRGTNITTENADLYKLPVGALIMEVAEGGPAEAAGLQVGDVITTFNGTTIMDMESLSELVGATGVGETAQIHVVRNGNTSVDLTITIGDKNAAN